MLHNLPSAGRSVAWPTETVQRKINPEHSRETMSNIRGIGSVDSKKKDAKLLEQAGTTSGTVCARAHTFEKNSQSRRSFHLYILDPAISHSHRPCTRARNF